MTKQKTIRDVKRFIPIFDAANTFVEEKQRFFEKIIPHLRVTRGVRWIIGITIGTIINPVGFILGILDP